MKETNVRMKYAIILSLNETRPNRSCTYGWVSEATFSGRFCCMTEGYNSEKTFPLSETVYKKLKEQLISDHNEKKVSVLDINVNVTEHIYDWGKAYGRIVDSFEVIKTVDAPDVKTELEFVHAVWRQVFPEKAKLDDGISLDEEYGEKYGEV